jgi:DnaJ family protein A protein 2
MFGNFHQARPNNPGTKLYEVLGINRDATINEIKKAYRKLSMKYHPDRPNGDEEKFKQINFANEILTDPERKEIYDEAGEEGLEQMAQGGDGPGIPDDLIDLLMPGMRRGRQRRGPKKSDNISTKLEVSLEDLYTGKTVQFELKRYIKCKKCNAKGTMNDSDIVKCKKCDGKGQVIHIRQMGPMIQQHIMPCNDCRGKGTSIKDGKQCKDCNGKRIAEDTFKTDISVRPGSKYGDQICLRGKAHDNPECQETGDLILIIQEKVNKSGFVRKDNDLIYNKTIDLVNALCGIEFYIKQLDGRFIKISYNGIIEPGQVMKIENEGMPILDEGGSGDLLIKFTINFPISLDEKRTDLLKKILPKSTDILEVKPNDDSEVSERELDVIHESETINNDNNHNEYFFQQHGQGDENESGAPECIQQ